MEHLRSNFCFKLLASIILFWVVMLYSQSFAYTVYYMDAESGITEMTSTTMTKLNSLNSKHAVATSYTIANTQENNDSGQEVIDYDQTIITSDGRYMQFLTAMELNGNKIRTKECNESCKILHGENHVCANVLTGSAMVLVYTDKEIEQEEETTQDALTEVTVRHKVKIGGATGNELMVHSDTYVTREEWQNGIFADLVQNVGDWRDYANKPIQPSGEAQMFIQAANNSNLSKKVSVSLTDSIKAKYAETKLNEHRSVTITIYYELSEQDLYEAIVYHIIKGGDIENENDHVKPVEHFGKGTVNDSGIGVSEIDKPELASQGTYKNMTIDFTEAYYTTLTDNTKHKVEPRQLNTSGDRYIEVNCTLAKRIYVCEYEVTKSRITVYLIEANPEGHSPGYTHDNPMKLQEDLGLLGKKHIVDTSKVKIIPFTQEYLQTFPDNWYEYFFDNPSIGVSRYNNGVGVVNIPSVLFDIPTSRGDIWLLPEFTHEGKNYKLVSSYVSCEYTNPLWSPISNLTCTSAGYTFSMFEMMQNPVVFAEYTAEGVPVNVHYVATTGEHSAGASNCKSYLTASELKETDVYTAPANSTYQVQLQKYINVNNKTYELVNSSVGPNKEFHVGSSTTTRNIAVANEEVHITAEYKEVVIPETPNSDTDGDGIDDWSETKTIMYLKVLNPLATAQISSVSRNNSNPTDIWNTTHKYYNFQNESDGKYYGIATHQNQYVQMLTASRNLFDMSYYKVEGTKYYFTTVNKTYNAVSWNGPHYVVACCGNSGTLSASSSSSGGGAADGEVDSRWRHDTIGCSHTTTKLDNCYNGTKVDESGRVYGLGGSCPNGGTRCNWTYSACCGHGNYCPGHGHWEYVPDPPEEDDDGGDSDSGSHGVGYHSLVHSTPLMGMVYVSDPCPAGGDCQHRHDRCHNCKRYDKCNGHADKFCTQTVFYCSAGCGGTGRKYQGIKEYQCEVSGGCISKSSFTVTREYKYKRQYIYYEPISYDAYMLQSLNVKNVTLGASGQVTLDNPTAYTLRSELYKPNESWLRNGWSEWSNYHVKDPIKVVSKTHDFNEHNETGYSNRCDIANGGVTCSSNWNSHSQAVSLAEKQAKTDLGVSTLVKGMVSEKTNPNSNSLGVLNGNNDLWQIGENCTLLRVRSDYLWHDGYIMEMYGRGGTETNVFAGDGINDASLSNASPSASQQWLSACGDYITNRQDVIAKAEDPEITTQGYTSQNTKMRNTTETISINSPSGMESGRRMQSPAGGIPFDYWYKYQNITIPRTIANNTYGSTATATYVKTSIPQLPNGSGAQTVSVAVNNFETNEVVVHAPVYVKASLNAKYEDTQLIIGENAQSKVTNNPLQVDKDYVLTVNTSGTHRSARGYGNANYQSWIKISGNKWMVQASFPYDVYVKEGNDYTFYKKGSWATFDKNDKTLEFKVAVWTEEKAYKNPVTSDVDNPSKASQILNNSIVVRVIAENEPDNLSSQNGVIGRKNSNYQKSGEYILYDSQTEGTPYDYRAYDSIDTQVVGKISGLEVEYTDDTGYRYMMQSGFSGVGVDQLPFGQKGDNTFNPYYNNGLLLGNKFKFTVMTKGTKASKVEITPSVYFVTSANDNTGLQEIDLYYRQDGNRYEKLGQDSTLTVYTNMKKPGELPYVSSEMMDLTKQIYDMYKAGTIQDRYWSGKLFSDFNGYNNLKNIGTVGKLTLDEYLRVRTDASKYYEQKKIYGNKTASQIIGHAGSVTNLAKSVSEYYGEYMLPSTSIFVKKGTSLYNRTTGKMQNIKTDGYLIVFFNIKAYDNEGKEYLNYQMPADNTGWQEEGYASEESFITLPNGKKVTKNIPETTNSGAVVIYEAHLNKDGQVVGKN